MDLNGDAAVSVVVDLFVDDDLSNKPVQRIRVEFLDVGVLAEKVDPLPAVDRHVPGSD